MDWVILLASGVLEAVWATALGRSDGLRRRVPTLVFVVASIASLLGLGFALNTLPTGTAYAVWTATGASLTVLWAMITGAERAGLVKVLLLLGIVTCVVGLKALA
ncbi:DMT family transporter [Tessaracoccus defluvii]|uniref:QacE family quaternary ammonium compound efflux SMR transporter n=1 Tax=Tessaracoccus defluvii TaxID=1285901 RepID=A0A7H0H402_9ACTN|nr:SMR family transporter [Tessaracoccus defluvii]QNP55268.1 QacE family quaternary ammonium compound efflux SMR transporter [Tessaracoccus defluvii]